MSKVSTKLHVHWDRALAWLLVLGGAGALTLGWVQISAAATRTEQLSYLVSAGLGGLLCLGIGATLLLTADLRDLRVKTAELVAVTSRAYPGAGPARRPGALRRMAAAFAAIWTLAAGGLVAGWLVAAEASDDEGAVPGVSLGVLSLLVCGSGAAAILTSLHRGAQLDKASAVPAITAWLAPASVDLSESAGPASGSANGRVLVGDGLRHYHRPGCRALMEVQARSVPRSAVPGDVVPCGICEA